MLTEAEAILARFLIADEPVGYAASTGPTSNRSIAAALQWLSQNVAHPDPLTDLHERGGVRSNHFRRLFKSMLQQTPRDYLLALRMRQASFQLAETNAMVKQIARRVGFDDPSYFSRRYHRFWNRWPTEDQAG